MIRFGKLEKTLDLKSSFQFQPLWKIGLSVVVRLGSGIKGSILGLENYTYEILAS